MLATDPGADVITYYNIRDARITIRNLDEQTKARLRADLRRIAANAEFREQIGRQAIDAKTLAPGEWSAFIKAELAKWGRLLAFDDDLRRHLR